MEVSYFIRQELAGRVVDRLLDQAVCPVTLSKTPVRGVVRVTLSKQPENGFVAKLLFTIITSLRAFPDAGERWDGDVGGLI